MTDVGVVEVQRKDADGKVRLRQYEIDFVVNLGLRKVYVQSSYRIDTEDKRNQEMESFRASGDFFRKIVVVDGYRQPLEDEEGIIRVGIIPFLLNPSILIGD